MYFSKQGAWTLNSCSSGQAQCVGFPGWGGGGLENRLSYRAHILLTILQIYLCKKLEQGWELSGLTWNLPLVLPRYLARFSSHRSLYVFPRRSHSPVCCIQSQPHPRWDPWLTASASKWGAFIAASADDLLLILLPGGGGGRLNSGLPPGLCLLPEAS